MNTNVDDGLTFAEVIANIPTDPMSVFVYCLLLVAVVWIAWENRPRRGGRPGG